MAKERTPVRRSAGTPRGTPHSGKPDVDLDAPIDALPADDVAENTVEAAPAAPVVDAIPTPKLATDDLMALAEMDPAELAALMEGSVERGIVNVGDKVTAPISRVGSDTLFVDLGGKSEGLIERVEFPDAVVGTQVTAYVIATGEWGVQLSKQLQGAAAAELVEEARDSGVPVEGKVVSRNKGGYEVRIGTVRAFCPGSMISRLPDMDPDSYIGQTLAFQVIETGDKVVVSRRALQEEEVAEQAEKLWATIAEGQEFRGTVRNTAAFGFFVDIGGIDGLVPKREIAWGGVDDPRTAVRVGQAVDVRVIDVDHTTKKLTFSCRNLADDPWQKIGSEYQEGGVYAGNVVRAEPYGVFVEIETGLSGLVHVSKMPQGLPDVGAPLEVRLLGVDYERRRLDLGPANGGVSTAVAAAPAEMLKGVVTEVLSNGVVVKLDDGRVGWLDQREVDLDAGTVLAQKFRRGKHVEARFLGERGGKVNLSTKTDDAGEDRAWRQAARAQSKKDSGFGTMGDLLKGLKL